MKLTVVIITKNEEQDLPRTLASLAFADRILVVDSGSTDQTVEVAKKHGAVVIEHPFTSYADQRNFADSQVTDGWTLSLEADVVVSEKLAAEIKNAIKAEDIKAYFIGRINIIWGAPLTVADWGPKDDNHIWLYQKGAGQWQSAVHEQYQTPAQTGQLKNTLLHYNYDTVSEYLDKINRYSDLARTKIPVSWLAGLVDFGKRYFYKLGFLAGYRGLFLSYLQAVYYLTLSVKQRGYTVTK